MSDYGKPMDGSEYAHGPVPARDRLPSAAAKAWVRNNVGADAMDAEIEAFARHEAVRAYDAGAAAERDRTCEWTTEDERLPDDQSGPYSTACGEEFYVTHGLEPYDFCPYCGGKIVVKPE